MPFPDPVSYFAILLCSKNSSKELFLRALPVKLFHPGLTFTSGLYSQFSFCHLPGGRIHPLTPVPGCPLIWLLRSHVSGVPSYFIPTHVGGQAPSVASSPFTPGNCSQSLHALSMLTTHFISPWVSSVNTRPYSLLPTWQLYVNIQLATQT